ncbi:MAG: tRNA (adenosine(37)-N6)-threonylcarbamoyltransferase complex ATPase subunit type 1 TsaE [Candidatus Omnitrophota bacterium]
MKPCRHFYSSSPDETLRFAAEFAGSLQQGDCIALEGNLGAGKTQFVKGIAEGLGFGDPDQVKSPTFVLLHVYPARLRVYHLDCYRLRSGKELGDLGFDEFSRDPQGVTCIEWADRVRRFLPLPRYEVSLKIVGEKARKIMVRKISEGSRGRRRVLRGRPKKASKG